MAFVSLLNAQEQQWTILESTPYGGFQESDAKKLLEQHKSESHSSPSLFVITGQSNVTGIRPNLSILSEAKSAGFSTLIDAAALASSARISLRQLPAADAMAVSFYKMFGYPTGVGALVAKKSFLATLGRKWFSGGTVDFVQAPGKLTLHSQDVGSRFEEGTLNYSSLSAIAPGLRFLSTYMHYTTIRLPSLHHYLHTSLESMVYPGTQTPLVRVHTKLRSMPSESQSRRSNSRERPPLIERSPRSSSPSLFLMKLFSKRSPMLPTPPITPPFEKMVSPFDDQLFKNEFTSMDGQGYVVSCTFYTSRGTMIPFAQVSRLASANGISLRTGCVCNPGGSAALRGKEVQEQMEGLSKFDDNVQLKDIMDGFTNSGVVRLSLGLVSNFEDVWRVLNWAQGLLDEAKRERDLERLGVGLSH